MAKLALIYGMRLLPEETPRSEGRVGGAEEWPHGARDHASYRRH